jgi:hypothetical protein
MAAKKKTNVISIILGVGKPMGKSGKSMKCPECGHMMDEGPAHESAAGDMEEDMKEAPMPKGKMSPKEKMKALKKMMS